MILDLTGRITTGEPTVTVRDAVRKEIDKSFKSLLLNMGEIKYIDSAGLGELIAAYISSARWQSKFGPGNFRDLEQLQSPLFDLNIIRSELR